jgi:PAS domain S-box-containing protein
MFDTLYQDIVACSADAVFACTPDGRIALWNAAASKLYRVGSDAVLGRRVAELPIEPARSLGSAIERVLTTHRAEAIEIDAPPAVLSVTVSPVGDDELRAVACCSRDVTDRVVAVDILQQATRVLEREVGERTAELAQLGMQLDSSLKNRDDFISMAGHELRTPLHVLRLQIEAVRRSPELLPDRMRERLDGMARQVRRLGSLVERLLDVSHLAAGRLRLEREIVDLSGLTREVCEHFVDEATGCGCSVGLDLQEGVCGFWDRTRLEQILTNLLSNAVKYGGGKPICVWLRAEAGMVRLEVRDNGIGISKRDVGRLFGRFERLVSDRTGGSGLGLWIVRQITEALGGRIDVESEPGLGTTFALSLPLTQAEA